MRRVHLALLTVALVPLQVWLVLRLREAVGWRALLLALLAIAFLLALAAPPSAFLARVLPRWGDARRLRSRLWLAVGATVAAAWVLAPLPGAPWAPALLATGLLRLAAAHALAWRDPRRRKVVEGARRVAPP